MINLTDRQSEIFKFLLLFIGKNGYPPTRQEIADGFGFHVNAAQAHLKALQAKGYISIPTVKRSRAITILRAA